MIHHERERGRSTICPAIYLYSVTVVSAVSCFIFLCLHVRTEFTMDRYVLLLLFGVIGTLLFPCLSRLKIGGVLEMEQRLVKEVKEAGVRETKKILFRGEVVQDEGGRRFYIDNAGERHLIKRGDDKTARFLASNKGVIPVSTEDLQPYRLTDPTEMDSVLEGRLLKSGPHIFVLLNGKKCWVGMDDLFDWGRHHESDWDEVDEEVLRAYPRWR